MERNRWRRLRGLDQTPFLFLVLRQLVIFFDSDRGDYDYEEEENKRG